MNLFCANHPLLVQNTFHYLYLASPDHMSHIVKIKRPVDDGGGNLALPFP